MPAKYKSIEEAEDAIEAIEVRLDAIEAKLAQRGRSPVAEDSAPKKLRGACKNARFNIDPESRKSIAESVARRNKEAAKAAAPK
jgi:hypothetical protein